jgi:hypothetical protein
MLPPRHSPMAEYQRHFGAHTIRIVVLEDSGRHLAQLFTVDDHDRLWPLLDDETQPVILAATNAADVYRDAVRFLTARFGPET